MKYRTELAKNKTDYTLKINDIYQYSKYNPKKIDKTSSISNQRDVLLIGLRLGYELETYLAQLDEEYQINVIYLSHEEVKLTKKFGNKHILENKRIRLFTLNESTRLDFEKLDLIIPLAYIKSMGKTHPLYSYLEDIKIKQLSYMSAKEKMYENFKKNQLLNASLLSEFSRKECKTAVLVSAGPSLQEYLYLLKEYRDNLFILCVGSALKILNNSNIEPDAVIITDASDLIQQQFENELNHILFYLSTANNETVLKFHGEKYMLFQKGLDYAEKVANDFKEVVLDTGGSVATTSISLIEKLNFETLVLFGQDLGFVDGNTHSAESPSNRTFDSTITFQKIESNAKKIINTTSSWMIYKKWIENKATNTKMKIYNISLNGAKIKGCPYIIPQQFIQLIKENEG